MGTAYLAIWKPVKDQKCCTLVDFLKECLFQNSPSKKKEKSSFYQQMEENLLPNYKMFTAFAC